MSTRNLDDLSSPMRWFAFELIARCAEAGLPVMVIDVKRTPEEQLAHLANGTSKTLKSKHLPDATGRSNAIDLCPYDTYQLHGPDKLKWDTKDGAWKLMADLAEEVADRQGITIERGFDWGWDPGHFGLIGISDHLATPA